MEKTFFREPVAPEQLSFDQLNIENEDNSEKLALIPYEKLDAKNFVFPRKRYFILSVIVHLVMTIYALTIVVEKFKQPDVIEVSYDAPMAAAPAPISKSFEEPAAISAPEIKSEAVVDDVVVVKPVPTEPVVKKATTVSKARTLPPPKIVEPVSPKPTMVSRPVVKASPVVPVEPLATVSDIEVPTLEKDTTDAEAAPKLSLKEIESDFDKIDESHNEKLVAANSDDSKMLEDSISDLDKVTESVSEEPSDIDDLAAERLENLQKQKVALKKATEEMAAAQAAAAAAQKAAATGKPRSTSQDKTNVSTGTEAGIGSESQGIVRKLEDLRQKPGNPRPTYDVADRLNGLSGTIVINAYVTKDGGLTLFRMIQSTGHKNLDKKTLEAIKEWKFYPGQEGWVELPFRWDLRGGVQQKPTLLKRR